MHNCLSCANNIKINYNLPKLLTMKSQQFLALFEPKHGVW